MTQLSPDLILEYGFAIATIIVLWDMNRNHLKEILKKLEEIRLILAKMG